MSTVKQISRKELTAIEVLDIIDDGGRVIIELSVLGKTTRVVIRHHSGTYYCDTPMKLLTFDDESELRDCLERYRLVRREAESEAERAEVST